MREALERVRRPGAFLAELEKAWRGWSSEPSPLRDAALRRLHYRPCAGARFVAEATYEARGSDGSLGHQFYSIHVYPEASRAHQRLAEYLRKPPLPCFGPPVHVVDAWNAVIFALPNGPRLRKLSWFLDPEGFRRLLTRKGLPLPDEEIPGSRVEVLRYVPRKRALLRYPARGDGPARVYVKAYTKPEYPVARRNHRRMARGAASGRLPFRTPPVLGSSKKRRALFLGELPGERLTEHYGSREAQALRAAGRALAAFHGASLKPAERWTAAGEFAALLRAMETLRSAVDGLDPLLADLLRDLEERRPEDREEGRTPIHANLFGDQILIHGSEVGIVDWDDLALGDPNFDMGRLAAHVLYEKICCREDPAEAEAVLSTLFGAYAEQAPVRLDPGRLQWHAATALLLRAKISALRPLPEGWTELVACSLLQARRVLEEGLPGLA